MVTGKKVLLFFVSYGRRTLLSFWKDILLIDCGNKTSDTDEAILPSIYTPKKMTSIKSKTAKVTQHISRRTLQSCCDSKAVKKKR